MYSFTWGLLFVNQECSLLHTQLGRSALSVLEHLSFSALGVGDLTGVSLQPYLFADDLCFL